MPQYVYMGRAREELRREMGITDDNQMVENPRWRASFEQLKKENAAKPEDKRLSDEELAMTPEAVLNIPRQIRAVEAITPEMVSERASRLYMRDHVPGGRPTSGSSGAVLSLNEAAQKYQRMLQSPPMNPQTGKPYSRDELKQVVIQQGVQRGYSEADIRKALDGVASVPQLVNASQLDELLRRSRIKDPSLNMEELRKRLAANQVSINEDK